MARPRRGRRRLRVTLYEPSGLGGVCHYTYQLAQALARQECEVTLITTEAYELAHLPRRFRVRYLFKPSLLKRLFSAIFRLGRPPRRLPDGQEAATKPRRPVPAWIGALRTRLLQTRMALELSVRRADVVHLQSVRWGREPFFVRLLGWLRIPVLYTAHELRGHEGEESPEPVGLGAISETVSRIIVHAQRTRDELLGLFSVNPGKVEVVPHGSYDFFFPEGRISKEDARARLGFPAGRPTILFFGLIKRYKGLEYLVEAFGRIEERVPDAVLAIVGNVFRGDPVGYAGYSRLMEEVSHRPNVLRVPGYVPVGKVGLYFSAADLVVLPYTGASQSGVLLGAFAAGRPVVVTDTGGLPEIVKNGRTGFVVPPRDPEALAGAIVAVLENPEMAETMGQDAARLADTLYSWDRIAARTVELYGSVLSDRRRRATRRLSTSDGPEELH